MKTIGLLWWMSRVSTLDYYTTINKSISAKLGKHHSAKIILHSIDYETIKKYDYKNRDAIGEILKHELERLASTPIDCILICNNTVHKAFYSIERTLNLSIPVFWIVDCVWAVAKEARHKNVLLLWTQFVMEDWFYHEKLESYWITVTIPSLDERKNIQYIIQTELVKNNIIEKSKQRFLDLISKYWVEAVIVGCTELPMLISQEDYKIPILNTVEIQCQKAISFSLEW